MILFCFNRDLINFIYKVKVIFIGGKIVLFDIFDVVIDLWNNWYYFIVIKFISLIS